MSAIPGASASSFAGRNDSLIQGASEDGGVLLPLTDGEIVPQALELAQTIAIGYDTGLLVLNAVCLPDREQSKNTGRTAW